MFLESKHSRSTKRSVAFDIEDSIYDLAYVALLDPVAMDEWEKDYPGLYMKRQNLTYYQSTSIFQGMLICIGIQSISVALLGKEFATSLTFSNERYLLLIPRLIFSYYMHNMLAGEIKDGINFMKYTVNHPDYFERKGNVLLGNHNAEGSEELRYAGKYTRLTYGFISGFA